MADLNVAGPNGPKTQRPLLDSAPPGGEKGSLVKNQQRPSDGQMLGMEAGNPQILALQGLKMIESGAQALVQGIPALEGPLGQILVFVRQAVPQALAGGNPMQAPSAAPAPGGNMAPPPPPGGPPPPQGGGMM